MTEIQSAVLVFALLLAATGLGAIVRPLLPEEHKAQETVQLIQLLVGMLVTFAALVLGLLTASAKTMFDTTNNDMRSYATSLIELDRAMRDYGAELDDARRVLKSYTAAAIASTWPLEPHPPGDYPAIEPLKKNEDLASPELGAMLSRAQHAVRMLQPQDAYHHVLATESAARFEQLLALRWKLIEESHGSISYPFDRILVGWLLIIFLCFGLIAPRNALSLVTIMLGALSIASAVLVILDLDTPFTGPIIVGSQPMRDALAYQSR
ncbi:hypothetical protein AWB79_01486 [Caballeronia hypogeia]|uniref:DUF4239 domain-containing protein n=1 Tax=Caballeronia hypogeia TaxID=1777140 RepID=A0A157ZWI2_9BURK|nr:hypothetical protein [Caballeronia hypogeia]SAK49865.1 hypothetical protein AWB79_01486 [Caballeronia hypogeia]